VEAQLLRKAPFRVLELLRGTIMQRAVGHFTNLLHTVNFRGGTQVHVVRLLADSREARDRIPCFNAYFVDEPEFDLLRDAGVKL
jgi:hypothetical protein